MPYCMKGATYWQLCDEGIFDDCGDLPSDDEARAIVDAAQAVLNLSQAERDAYAAIQEKRWEVYQRTGRTHWDPPRPEQGARPKKRRGYVYLMSNQRNGYTKIGFSTNPTVRERTLQSEEPEVMLLAKVEGTLEDEAALHEEYDHLRVRGEWFDLDREDLLDIQGRWALVA